MARRLAPQTDAGGGLPRGPDGVLHRHHDLHRLQGLRGRLQELERLSSDVFTLSGDSYDNTRQLNGENWRHVQFIEQFPEDRAGGRWLMMSDVCKHCVHAGCLEVCPTGAIIRTEYDTVVIQADVCNGCRDCIAACPFGVIEINPVSQHGDEVHPLLRPACRAGWSPPAPRHARPSRSSSARIEELHEIANERVQQLNAQARDAGQPEDAYLYGADDSLLGGLNAFFLLVDQPEVYHLPAQAKLPSKEIPAAAALGIGGTLGMAALGAVAFRKRRMDEFAEDGAGLSGRGREDAPPT